MSNSLACFAFCCCFVALFSPRPPAPCVGLVAHVCATCPSLAAVWPCASRFVVVDLFVCLLLVGSVGTVHIVLS